MPAQRTARRAALKEPRPLSPKALVRALIRTLEDHAVDPEVELERRGQLAALEARRAGYGFSLSDHLRALVLAWLTGRRPWSRIGSKLGEIDRIFRGYAPGKLTRLDPGRVAEQLCELACGNRAIHAQLQALPWNVKQLKRIARDHGSLDDFVESDEPLVVARLLSRPGSPYKLEQVGLPIALEYLRSVGIDLPKPTALVRRALGPERLGLHDGAPSHRRPAFDAVRQLSAQTDRSMTEIDSLFWLFCAPDQAAVCGIDPRCDACRLSASCAEGLRRQQSSTHA